MKILSIETSCDETAISILEAEGVFGDTKNPVKFEILANTLISQIDIHKEYGGVFPALAKREHAKNLIPILRKTLDEAKLSSPTAKSKNPWTSDVQVEKVLEREPDLLKLFLDYIPTIEIPKIDAIAVTQGPGLEPALWVGINFAKALSYVWDKPLIPVNHMEGHLFASFLESKVKSQKSKVMEFPAIGLLISGGHTELILMKEFRNYEKIGQTRDDAIGEAFDKVARMMDLPYPGGPEISKLAQAQREKLTKSQEIKLPRPMLNTDDFDFSFSGLKTAVLYLIKDIKAQEQKNIKTKGFWIASLSLAKTKIINFCYRFSLRKNPSLQEVKHSKTTKKSNTKNFNIKLPQEIKEEIALEFETAVTEILLKKTEKAIEKYQAKTLILGGGVIANNYIRQSFESLGYRISKLEVLIPEREYSTDNAVMIGIAGYFKYLACPPMRREQKEKGQLQTAIDLKELHAEGNLKL